MHPSDKLRPYVENITDYAIYMLDPSGRVASWNAGARDIKGYSESEVLGRHFSMFYVQDGTEHAASGEMLARALRDGHAASEGWRVRKNGERFWASVVITAVHDEGSLVGFSKVTRDLTERKLVEDKLRASEERYRLLVDGVREYAIYSLDPEGHVASWNTGAARTKGYAAEEIVGRHFSVFYPVLEIAAGAPQRELEVAAREGRFESEGWRIRKDGKRFWAHLVLTAIREDGRLIGYSKVTRDISERRATEEALRRSEERLRQLIAGVRDYAIIGLDLDGTVSSWNAGAEQIKGWRAEEIVGRHFSAFYPPADVALTKPQRELELAIEKGRFEEEGWRVRKDGSRFWAHVVLTTIVEQGVAVGFSKVTRDITDRKRAEASLEGIRHLLEASHSMSKLGGWELDLETDEMLWTEQTYRIHGVDPATHTPTLPSWLAFFPPHAIQELSGAMLRAMQVGEGFSLELPFVAGDGRSGWVHVTSRVVLAHGKPSRIAGAIQDVTQRKAAELEVRELNASLERRVLERTEVINRMNERLTANEAVLQQHARELAAARDMALDATRVKAALLANVSHEIRTPLAGIIGLADVLASTDLSPPQAELLRAIRASGAGLLSTLNDILDVSKLEAGKVEPALTTFEVRRLFEDALDVVAVEAAEKNLDLAWRVEADVPPCVVGDFGRMRQIVVNLLANAVKFTSQGSVVTTVRLAPGTPLALEVGVRDTGIGVPVDKRHRLFEAFSQVDGSISREYGGTGLGLALCKALSELLGGSIAFEPGVPAGSCFRVVLPVEAVADTSSPAWPELVGRRVLLLQAECPSRHALAHELGTRGAEVRVGDALAAPSDDLDGALIVVDWDKRHEGAALARRLATAGASARTLLLRWRGPPSEDERGFDAIVWKPIRSEQLRRAVRGSLGVPQDSVRPTSPRETIGAEVLRVLVVDDNGLNRLVATHMLTKLGHESVVATDGPSALARIAEEAFDVILMDVQMPGLDGLETTERIRRTRPEAGRPWIIAMTAHALAGDRERCLAAGMDDYLSKPVDLLSLESSLARVDRRGRPARAPNEENEEGEPPDLAPANGRASAGGTGWSPEVVAVLDVGVLDELRSLGSELGAPLLADLLRDLQAHDRASVDALTRELGSGDLRVAADLAHTLRGSLATIGARGLVRLLETAERAALAGDREAALAQLPDVSRSHAELLAVVAGLTRSMETWAPGAGPRCE